MKDVYYFSHDSSARRDPKMIALMKKYGVEGYGVFFILIEIMSEQHGYKIEKFPKMINGIAGEIGIPDDKFSAILEYIITECELLKQDDKYIWSNSLMRRKDVQNEKRQVKVEAGRIGGIKSGEARSKTKHNTNENEAENEANEAVLEATNQSKVKESKAKESKEKKNTTTESAGADGGKLVNWDNCKTDLQRLLAHYISIESPELYKTATRNQATGLFKRYGRAASELLAVAGGIDTAKRAFDLAMAHFNRKGLSWTLDTVTANSAEFVNQALKEKSNGTR